jgi:predicted transcriptional regulator
MTVGKLVEILELKVLSGDNEALTRSVEGGYCGDLLSWVMGRAPTKCVWITIMSNINVAAVAELADVSCVILAEGVSPDEQLLQRAEKDNLALLQSGMPSFALAGRVCSCLNDSG